MLALIPRYAPVANADVGPRFVEYATYTRAGASLQVVAAAKAFEMPARLISARATVQAKVYIPFGYVRATAGLVQAVVTKPKVRPNTGVQTIATASILGVAPIQDFGYCT